jgi:hypothetical protein
MEIEFSFASSEESDGEAVFTTANCWSLDPRAVLRSTLHMKQTADVSKAHSEVT